jgi:hypothetical protein
MGHRPPHLGVLGAHFYHLLGHVPQAPQRAGRTRANFRVADLAVPLFHMHIFIASVLGIITNGF